MLVLSRDEAANAVLSLPKTGTMKGSSALGQPRKARSYITCNVISTYLRSTYFAPIFHSPRSQRKELSRCQDPGDKRLAYIKYLHFDPSIREFITRKAHILAQRILSFSTL